MKQFGFEKKEKLKSSKEIQKLFTTGKSEFEFPIKLMHQKLENSNQRNRIKRIIREIYRLNKLEPTRLSSSLNSTFNFIFVYVGDVNIRFDKTEKAIKSLLLKAVNSNELK